MNNQLGTGGAGFGGTSNCISPSYPLYYGYNGYFSYDYGIRKVANGYILMQPNKVDHVFHDLKSMLEHIDKQDKEKK